MEFAVSQVDDAAMVKSRHLVGLCGTNVEQVQVGGSSTLGNPVRRQIELGWRQHSAGLIGAESIAGKVLREAS